MNRLRRATIVASFSYLQYALALASGLLMVPLTLQQLGPRTYGLWLASGELLGYAAMVDLGVIGVLPWMLAEADGRGDRDAMRRLVANGVVVGLLIAVAYGLLATLLWLVLPSALTLGAADRAAVVGPLTILVVTMVVTYPFRIASAMLAGLQDATFNGWLAVTQSLVAIGLTAGLLKAGFGLYALAVGAAAAAVVTAVGASLRARVLAPDLWRNWPRPSLTTVRMLLSQGLGVWGGAFGWQLVAASNGLVMTALGHPEWIAIYACTAKLTAIATQLAWVLPDAGLVGLAQVQGESPHPDRLRPVTLLMLRLHLWLAGGAACVVLVFNPAFVQRWVGGALFGGVGLTLLLTAGMVAAGLVHGLLACASVVGHRLRVGGITVVQGLVQVVSALACGHLFGLSGIAAAAVVTGVLVSVPAGVRLLAPATAISLQTLMRDLIGPWIRRAWPLLALSASLSLLLSAATWPVALAVALALGLAYAWRMRPLLADLPIDPRLERWLVRLRLGAGAAAPAVADVPGAAAIAGQGWQG